MGTLFGTDKATKITADGMFEMAKTKNIYVGDVNNNFVPGRVSIGEDGKMAFSPLAVGTYGVEREMRSGSVFFAFDDGSIKKYQLE